MTYRVYAHSIEGQVFYVGQGAHGRPWGNYSRNLLWHRHVKNNGGDFSVSILAECETQLDARRIEKEHIERLRPLANIQFNSLARKKSSRLVSVTCRTTPAVTREIKRLARRSRWSLSKVLAKLIEKGLAKAR